MYQPFWLSFCSNPGHPFAAGVTLEKLSAVTIDDSGKETFVTGGALECIQKVPIPTILVITSQWKKQKDNWFVFFWFNYLCYKNESINRFEELLNQIYHWNLLFPKNKKKNFFWNPKEQKANIVVRSSPQGISSLLQKLVWCLIPKWHVLSIENHIIWAQIDHF